MLWILRAKDVNAKRHAKYWLSMTYMATHAQHLKSEANLLCALLAFRIHVSRDFIFINLYSKIMILYEHFTMGE